MEEQLSKDSVECFFQDLRLGLCESQLQSNLHLLGFGVYKK